MIVGPARLLPAFLLLFSLPLFLIILPLHSPSTRCTINGCGVSGTTVRARQNFTHRRQAFKAYSQAAPAYVSTEQPLHGVNYNIGSASGRGLTGTGNRHWRLKKNDRDRNMLFTRAQFPGGRFPAKFGYQPIKLEL